MENDRSDEVFDRAKSIDGHDYAGALDVPNDLAVTLAIVAAGYSFTVTNDGYVAALVGGDMGYAVTDIKLDDDTVDFLSAPRAENAQVAEPVAWVRQRTLDRLREGHSGAYDCQLANVSFPAIGNTIPLYLASPPAQSNYPGIPDGWALVPVDAVQLAADLLNLYRAKPGWKEAADALFDALAASPPAPQAEVAGLEVDDLAQIIRRVDGDNSLGAGALAEAIVAALSIGGSGR